MGLKKREVLSRQKETFERSLKARLDLLKKKGIEPAKADKDTIVRKLKADVRAAIHRLALVAASEKLTADHKKMKADRAAAALKEKEAATAEKPKKAPQEAKPKKEKGEKGEKKPAGPKPQEGGKAPKAEGAPEEAKAAPKKKEAPEPPATPTPEEPKPKAE